MNTEKNNILILLSTLATVGVSMLFVVFMVYPNWFYKLILGLGLVVGFIILNFFMYILFKGLAQ